MLTNNDLITVPQAVALMITVILEISLLSLPRHVAMHAGPDSWLAVIAGGIFAFVGSLVLATLIRRFPRDTFVEISQKVIGKTPTFLFSIVLIVYFVVATALIARQFAEVINAFMLVRTPREFIIITQLLLTVYLTRHGIEPTARIAEILFPILIIPVLVMYFIALPKADYTELLPFLKTPAKPLLYGSFSAMLSFFGIEILLMMGPYFRSPGRIYWVMFVSVSVCTMIYLIIVPIVLASLGIESTKRLLWPGITLIRSIVVPGRITERLDAVALSLWTIASFTTLNGYYLTAAFVPTHLFKAREFKFFITILFPWIYLISIIPTNVIMTEKLIYMVKLGSLVVGLIIPLAILLLSLALKKGGDSP